MSYRDILGQLEETKFLRLFRRLVDGTHPVREGTATTIATPIDIADAEVYLKTHERSTSLGSYFGHWAFQLAHFPQFLWHHEETPRLIEERLKTCFLSLRARPNTLRSLLQSFVMNDLHDSTYYVFTNACYCTDETELEHFSDTAHRLFYELTGVPRNVHPSFGIGTPETVIRNARRDGLEELNTFLLELINMPSSYYLVAREGRICVIPTTEHGAFIAKSNSGGVKSVASSALHRGVLDSHITDFEDLLNNPRAKEADLQAFLSEYPNFIFSLDERYCEVRPHICLSDCNRDRLIPDFMVRLEGTDIWDIIELKLPSDKMTVHCTGTMRASAPTARAIAELLRYRDFFSRRGNRRLITKRFGVTPYEPNLVLVIGRGYPHERFEWRSAYRTMPSVQIVSYDFLFQRAREQHMMYCSPA